MAGLRKNGTVTSLGSFLHMYNSQVSILGLQYPDRVNSVVILGLLCDWRELNTIV